MKHRYIIQQPSQGRIVPRIDCGLFFGRRSARVAAKDHGYPPQLIKKVTRNEYVEND